MVFKNEETLYPEYLPPNLPHRETQIKYLADTISLIAQNKRAQNIFIYGPPGIGKTAVVKYVLREFENYSGIKCIYVNCWTYNTSFSILSEIARNLDVFVPRRGWAKDEIFSRILETINKNKISLVLALDEIDILIKNDHQLLYDLSRINNYTQQKFLLIFISNDKHAFVKVDERIKSSLDLKEIEFRPYTFLEMKDIIEERMKLAFTSYEPGISAVLANKTVEKGGDIRFALKVLLQAGRIAKEKLRLEDVKKVLLEESLDTTNEKIENLSEEEKFLVNLLNTPKTSKELYEEFSKLKKISVSGFKKILKDLENRRIIIQVGWKNKFKLYAKVEK